MGALRRPQLHEEDRPIQADAVEAPPVSNSYPRWAVVSGLIIYCALFWGIVIIAGTWGLEMVRTAAASLR